MGCQRDSKDVVKDTFMKLGLDQTKRWFFKLVEDNLDFAQMVSDSYRDMLIHYYKENFNRVVEREAARELGRPLSQPSRTSTAAPSWATASGKPSGTRTTRPRGSR